MTRPVGRPPVGRSYHLRLPTGLLAAVDAYAKQEKLTRAAAVRVLLAGGLARSADR